jgi:D-alanyl-D-alanine carboxypeptidase
MMSFQIGSNTKIMTAAVILLLHEEGRLSVYDPLSVWLPEISARLPHGADITLRQLLQHRSGVFSDTDTAPDGTPGFAVASMQNPEALRRPITPQQMIDFTIDHGAPLFVPGEPGKWA